MAVNANKFKNTELEDPISRYRITYSESSKRHLSKEGVTSEADIRNRIRSIVQLGKIQPSEISHVDVLEIKGTGELVYEVEVNGIGARLLNGKGKEVLLSTLDTIISEAPTKGTGGILSDFFKPLAAIISKISRLFSWTQKTESKMFVDFQVLADVVGAYPYKGTVNMSKSLEVLITHLEKHPLPDRKMIQLIAELKEAQSVSQIMDDFRSHEMSDDRLQELGSFIKEIQAKIAMLSNGEQMMLPAGYYDELGKFHDVLVEVTGSGEGKLSLRYVSVDDDVTEYFDRIDKDQKGVLHSTSQVVDNVSAKELSHRIPFLFELQLPEAIKSELTHKDILPRGVGWILEKTIGLEVLKEATDEIVKQGLIPRPGKKELFAIFNTPDSNPGQVSYDKGAHFQKDVTKARTLDAFFRIKRPKDYQMLKMANDINLLFKACEGTKDWLSDPDYGPEFRKLVLVTTRRLHEEIDALKVEIKKDSPQVHDLDDLYDRVSKIRKSVEEFIIEEQQAAIPEKLSISFATKISLPKIFEPPAKQGQVQVSTAALAGESAVVNLSTLNRNDPASVSETLKQWCMSCKVVADAGDTIRLEQTAVMAINRIPGPNDEFWDSLSTDQAKECSSQFLELGQYLAQARMQNHYIQVDLPPHLDTLLASAVLTAMSCKMSQIIFEAEGTPPIYFYDYSLEVMCKRSEFMQMLSFAGQERAQECITYFRSLEKHQVDVAIIAPKFINYPQPFKDYCVDYLAKNPNILISPFVKEEAEERNTNPKDLALYLDLGDKQLLPNWITNMRQQELLSVLVQKDVQSLSPRSLIAGLQSKEVISNICRDKVYDKQGTLKFRFDHKTDISLPGINSGIGIAVEPYEMNVDEGSLNSYSYELDLTDLNASKILKHEVDADLQYLSTGKSVSSELKTKVFEMNHFESVKQGPVFQEQQLCDLTKGVDGLRADELRALQLIQSQDFGILSEVDEDVKDVTNGIGTKILIKRDTPYKEQVKIRSEKVELNKKKHTNYYITVLKESFENALFKCFLPHPRLFGRPDTQRVFEAFVCRQDLLKDWLASKSDEEVMAVAKRIVEAYSKVELSNPLAATYLCRFIFYFEQAAAASGKGDAIREARLPQVHIADGFASANKGKGADLQSALAGNALAIYCDRYLLDQSKLRELKSEALGSMLSLYFQYKMDNPQDVMLAARIDQLLSAIQPILKERLENESTKLLKETLESSLEITGDIEWNSETFPIITGVVENVFVELDLTRGLAMKNGVARGFPTTDVMKDEKVQNFYPKGLKLCGIRKITNAKEKVEIVTYLPPTESNRRIVVSNHMKDDKMDTEIVILQKIKSGSREFWGQYHQFQSQKNMSTVAKPDLPNAVRAAIGNKDCFIDTSNPQQVYVLDAKGVVVARMKLTSDGKIEEYRRTDGKVVLNPNKEERSFLKAFEGIEAGQNILIFGVKGQPNEVMMPRLKESDGRPMTFLLQKDGRWKCGETYLERPSNESNIEASKFNQITGRTLESLPSTFQDFIVTEKNGQRRLRVAMQPYLPIGGEKGVISHSWMRSGRVDRSIYSLVDQKVMDFTLLEGGISSKTKEGYFYLAYLCYVHREYGQAAEFLNQAAQASTSGENYQKIAGWLMDWKDGTPDGNAFKIRLLEQMLVGSEQSPEQNDEELINQHLWGKELEKAYTKYAVDQSKGVPLEIELLDSEVVTIEQRISKNVDRLLEQFVNKQERKQVAHKANMATADFPLMLKPPLPEKGVGSFASMLWAHMRTPQQNKLAETEAYYGINPHQRLLKDFGALADKILDMDPESEEFKRMKFELDVAQPNDKTGYALAAKHYLQKLCRYREDNPKLDRSTILSANWIGNPLGRSSIVALRMKEMTKKEDLPENFTKIKEFLSFLDKYQPANKGVQGFKLPESSAKSAIDQKKLLEAAKQTRTVALVNRLERAREVLKTDYAIRKIEIVKTNDQSNSIVIETSNILPESISTLVDQFTAGEPSDEIKSLQERLKNFVDENTHAKLLVGLSGGRLPIQKIMSLYVSGQLDNFLEVEKISNKNQIEIKKLVQEYLKKSDDEINEFFNLPLDNEACVIKGNEELKQDVIFARNERLKEENYSLTDAHLTRVEKELVAQLAIERSELKKLQRSLDIAVNGDPQTKAEKLQAELRVGRLPTQRIIGLFASGQLDEFLDQKKIPDVNQGEILKLVQQYMTKYVVVSHLEYTQVLAEECRSNLTNEKVPEPLATTLHGALAAKRQYNVETDPLAKEFMLIEFGNGFFLRADQLATTKEMIADPSAVKQSIMGSGKSKVILPVLCQAKATGSNLIMAVVPDWLYETNLKDMESFSVTFYGKKPLAFPFKDQPKFLELSALQKLYASLSETVKNKSYAITTKRSQIELKHALNRLRDMEVKAMGPEKLLLQEQIELLTEIKLLITNRGERVMDEIDSEMDARKEVNDAEAGSIKIAETKQKASLDIMRILVKSLKDNPDEKSKTGSLAKLADSIIGNKQKESISKKDQNNGRSEKDEMLDALAKALHTDLFKMIGESKFIDYVRSNKMGLMQKGEKFNEKGVPDFIDQLKTSHPETYKLIVRYKDCIVALGEALNTTGGVDWGMDPTNPGRFIPYKGSDQPSIGSEHDGDFQKLVFHAMGFLQGGLTVEMMADQIERFKEQAVTQAQASKRSPNPLELNNTPAALEFKALLNANDPDKTIFPENLTLFTLSDDDPEKITHLLNKSSEAKLNYLEKVLFPSILLSQEQLRGTAHDYASMGKALGGFTGTLWNGKSYPKECHVSPTKGVDGKSILILMDLEKMNKLKIVTLEPGDPVKQMAKKISTENYHAGIDAGAYAKGKSSEVVVDDILSNDKNERFKSAVYTDGSGEIKNKSKSGGDPMLHAHVQGDNPKERPTWYSIFIGADVKQWREARALQSIAPEQFLKDMLQGMWRMRGLGQGQSVDFAATPEIKALVMNGKEGDPKLKNLISFNNGNQSKRAAEDNTRSETQRILGFIPRLMDRQLDEISLDRAFGEREDRFFILDKFQSIYREYIFTGKPSDDQDVDASAGLSELDDPHKVLGNQQEMTADKAKVVLERLRGISEERPLNDDDKGVVEFLKLRPEAMEAFKKYVSQLEKRINALPKEVLLPKEYLVEAMERGASYRAGEVMVQTQQQTQQMTQTQQQTQLETVAESGGANMPHYQWTPVNPSSFQNIILADNETYSGPIGGLIEIRPNYLIDSREYANRSKTNIDISAYYLDVGLPFFENMAIGTNWHQEMSDPDKGKLDEEFSTARFVQTLNWERAAKLIFQSNRKDASRVFIVQTIEGSWRTVMGSQQETEQIYRPLTKRIKNGDPLYKSIDPAVGDKKIKPLKGAVLVDLNGEEPVLLEGNAFIEDDRPGFALACAKAKFFNGNCMYTQEESIQLTKWLRGETELAAMKQRMQWILPPDINEYPQIDEMIVNNRSMAIDQIPNTAKMSNEDFEKYKNGLKASNKNLKVLGKEDPSLQPIFQGVKEPFYEYEEKKYLMYQRLQRQIDDLEIQVSQGNPARKEEMKNLFEKYILPSSSPEFRDLYYAGNNPLWDAFHPK